MTTPTVNDMAARFMLALEAADADAVRTMLDAMERLVPRLTRDAEVAAERVAAMKQAGDAGWRSYAAKRARAIAADVQGEVTRLARSLVPAMETAQTEAMLAGLGASRQLVIAAGFDGPWRTAPLEAVRAMVGAQQAEPVRRLLANLGPKAGEKVREHLTAGLVRGSSPRVVARQMAKDAALPGVRALAIARTETLRSFRIASQASYAAQDGLVTGYRRLAANGPRTCALCRADNGAFYEVTETMPTHVQCRCAMVPVTIGNSTAGPRGGTAAGIRVEDTEWGPQLRAVSKTKLAEVA
jgi:SPP1 gp7 family putative phage head morphogenesis protein